MKAMENVEIFGGGQHQGDARKEGWKAKFFEECIESVKYTRKIQRKDFLNDGRFPIVSQEAEFTNGYWNDEADVFKVSTPVVIFGDHTQALKYVDFDFVLGADGVKILPPRDFLFPKFFFYQLLATSFTTLGYARHYRLLKELKIIYPPLPEQRRIVALLDEAFAGLATAKTNVERNLQSARAIFESHLQAVFRQRGEGWAEKKLEEIGRTQTGSTPKTSDNSNYGDFIAFVKPGDFKVDGTLDYGKDGLSKTGAHGARIVPAESVLMVCIGATIGKPD
jgi:type I restriction enzyme S subunit